MFLDNADIDFEFKPNDDFGSADLRLENGNDVYFFYLEFKVEKESECDYSCHCFNQELPDEVYYVVDTLTEIKDFDKLIKKIEFLYGVENIGEKLFIYIRDMFDKTVERVYSHTIRG